jgi:diguanylate cyclase (GGDEF)-like protein
MSFSVATVWLLVIVSLFSIKKSVSAAVIVYGVAAVIGTIGFQTAVIHIAVISFISWRMASKPNGLIKHTLFIWILFAGPLMALIYTIQNGAIDQIGVFYIQKEITMALLSSLFVDILFTYSPLRYVNRADRHITRGFYFSHITTHAVLVAITIPYLIYVGLSGINNSKAVVDYAESRFESRLQTIESYLNNKTSIDIFMLKKQDVIQKERLNQELLGISKDEDTEIVIMDENNIVLGSNTDIPGGKPFDWSLGGSIDIEFEYILYWVPDSEFGYELEKFKHAYIIQEKELPGIKLKAVMMMPYSPFLSNLLSVFISQLWVYLFFSLAMVMMGLLSELVFFKPLAKLAETTTGIPVRLTKGNCIEWRKSKIVEIDMLTDNFKTVTDDLKDMFYRTYCLAYYDSLTGLPNRLFMQDALAKLFKTCSEDDLFALMFFDLDHFKQVNDTLGHDVGDQLLQVIAKRLKVIETEFINVYRVSGDEFVVIAEQVEHKMVKDIAEHILELISKPVWISQHELHITSSIGIALYPHHGKNAETLMRLADASMYVAKEEGRNTYVLYTESLQTRLAEQLWLEQQLRKAIDLNQFTLHYQAIVDGVSSNINGFEVFVRWNHPEKGWISPEKFIPVAEQTGLIIPLGSWVLRQACLQNKKWQEAGFQKVRVGVNLSVRQLYSGNLSQEIQMILEDTGLKPQYLGIEITESFMIKDYYYVNTVLKELKAMGVTVSIDDFGTGYSSLGRLKFFSVNAVKIDKSFVRNVEADRDNASIVKAVIELAHGMNLKVVAEGIETEEERSFLVRHNCDEMQGYYFEKPMDAERFAQAWHKRMSNSEILERLGV